MEYLKCEKVRKQFGSVQALKDLSFSVEKGEIRAILGGNGSGKSTMAKIIGGALDVTSGTIKLNGKDYAPKSPAEAKQFGVIFTSQELSLFDNLNVEENIHLCNLPLGKGDSIDHQRVNQSTLDLAQKYGLEYLLNIPIAQMAANELYLVEFLKAIIQKPTLLIVDEITSALYRNDVEKVRDILFELKEAGCTILFISHRMGEIMSICDTITDALPTQITLDTNSVTISKNGAALAINTDYTLTTAAGGFTLTLTPAARAALKDNDVLVVSYQATLQPNTTTMDAYTNTATLSYGEDKSISDTADVFSGHITFEKRDNHNNILAGAKFVVKNLDGQYAKLNGSGHTWAFDSWVDAVEQATVITTENTTTAVIVRGLKSGIYTLVETEAPNGFVKGSDTEITINKELSEEQGNRLIGLFTEKAIVINTQGSELPETGGIGTTIFYIAGALLAVSAVALLIVKRRKQA